MTRSTHLDDDDMPDRPTPRSRSIQRFRGLPWKRWALWTALPVIAALIFLSVTWNTFFKYVPPGQLLVVISKNGDPLPAGQVLAEKGQKGIQREVLGEGWHFVMPVVYTTELAKMTEVPPGKVGIVTALGGVHPREGRVLAEQDDEQGIRRHVMLPGVYRLNPYGYKVDLADRVEVRPGYVGVVRRLLGKDGSGRFADNAHEKGMLRDVLQPGYYYMNTKEFEIIPAEVGIYQTSYRHERNTSITFPGRDGNTIGMDCTIEWEVLPSDIPALVAEYREHKVIERNVVDQQARKICRDRGFNYGAQDFLDGEKREKFQEDFTKELEKACREKNVVVRSAFIRNITIPEDFLKQKRDRQLAVEMKITNKAKQETAQSEATLQREKSLVLQSEIKVQAETAALVAGIEQEVENVIKLADAEVEKLKSEYAAKTAELDADRKKAIGAAEATVTQLKETAKSSLYKMKMDVFQNDGNAYLRYTLADQINPKLQLRLFHAGPGTFWTNMGDKNMQFLLPAAGGPTPTEAPKAAEVKPMKP